MKSLVVYSGGLDSTVALYNEVDLLGADNVMAVSFNYGSKHNDREYSFAKKNTELLNVKHERLPLTFINDYFDSALLKNGEEIPEGHYEAENMKRTVVPFRNGIMLSIATGLAESRGCDRVVLGNHFGDHAIYPDCREEFIEYMSKAMGVGTYNKTQIHSPFCKIRKEDIVSRGEELSVPWKLTWSCYKGGEIHCGKCGTCVERKEAFELAGVIDPTEYED